MVILSEFYPSMTMKDLKNPNKLYVPSNDFVANLNSIYNASLTATSNYTTKYMYLVLN